MVLPISIAFISDAFSSYKYTNSEAKILKHFCNSVLQDIKFIYLLLFKNLAHLIEILYAKCNYKMTPFQN